jgi:hypothetical protein
MNGLAQVHASIHAMQPYLAFLNAQALEKGNQRMALETDMQQRHAAIADMSATICTISSALNSSSAEEKARKQFEIECLQQKILDNQRKNLLSQSTLKQVVCDLGRLGDYHASVLINASQRLEAAARHVIQNN